ncbi:hypothetical protein FGO68_gene4178 [Halteria grandinella]|uniref:Uncharacterized protein n=1 Tax=Halteria grandinella TaxID=5974 RepID=A0A8J8NPC0_HALGN|nr:hypothetical protein FGO68_gene4178 [Halteria grandinella]
MGCTASSGAGGSHTKKKVNLRYYRLQRTNIWSVDRLADQVEEVVERMARMTDDIDRKRARIDSLTQFDWYKAYGVKLRQPVYAILLTFLAVANGDLSKVKVDFKEKKPFIKISLNGLSIEGADNWLTAWRTRCPG